LRYEQIYFHGKLKEMIFDLAVSLSVCEKTKTFQNFILKYPISGFFYENEMESSEIGTI
jgi:hypothetical protein